MDIKLELVILPVSDVDRAKDFYERVGFHVDMDQRVSPTLRFVQLTASKEAVGDGAQWLKDGTVCVVTLWNGVPLQVTPPAHMELKVVETDPGVRGDTATGGSKPAKLETGAMVRVPLFINEGEILRIDTRTGEYLSRGKN